MRTGVGVGWPFFFLTFPRLAYLDVPVKGELGVLFEQSGEASSVVVCGRPAAPASDVTFTCEPARRPSFGDDMLLQLPAHVIPSSLPCFCHGYLSG